MATKIHDCEKEKCSGSGLGGLFLLCDRCEKKNYLECLIQERDILMLLKTIGLVKCDNTQVTSTITEDNKKTLNDIINTKTLIDFTCKKCKQKGSTLQILKSLNQATERAKKTIEELKNNLQIETQKVNKLQEENEVLEQTIRSNKQLIEEMTERDSETTMLNTGDSENVIHMNADEDENSTMNRREIYELINKAIPSVIKKNNN